jgi:hypothetical protein
VPVLIAHKTKKKESPEGSAGPGRSEAAERRCEGSTFSQWESTTGVAGGALSRRVIRHVN